MTDVWIVMPMGYDDCGIYGVYDSPEAAMAAWPNDWVQQGDGNYSNDGSSLMMGSFCVIERWTVSEAVTLTTDTAQG